MGIYPLYSLYFALRRFPIRVIRQDRDVLNRSGEVVLYLHPPHIVERNCWGHATSGYYDK